MWDRHFFAGDTSAPKKWKKTQLLVDVIQAQGQGAARSFTTVVAEANQPTPTSLPSPHTHL